jgi:hypothetical protein
LPFSIRSKRLSSSSTFLQSITQLILADWPQPVSSSLGLSAPSALARIEGPLAAGFACPLRSALRVWLPSRRLPPFGPLPVLFHTGGAPGIRPSELSPLKKYSTVSDRIDPHTVSPAGIPAAETAGPARWAPVPGS